MKGIVICIIWGRVHFRGVFVHSMVGRHYSSPPPLVQYNIQIFGDLKSVPIGGTQDPYTLYYEGITTPLNTPS